MAPTGELAYLAAVGSLRRPPRRLGGRHVPASLVPRRVEAAARVPGGHRLRRDGLRRGGGRSESTLEAAKRFRSALERDSSYALAWAGLADADLLRRRVGTLDSITRSAEDAALRALAIDPDLAEAHASLAIVRMDERDGPAALEMLERAVELQPSYPQAYHWLAFVQLLLGRPDAAL